MANNERLDDRELANLRECLNNLMRDLESDKEAVIKFLERPFEFLRRKKIKAIDYIENCYHLRNLFVRFIHDLIGL